jgi:biopolymer transport protein ExbD
MAFRLQSSPRRSQPNAEINMVPLIDVMLVLVIIFMVTAPLMTHAVKVELPRAASQPNEIKPQTIAVSIRQDGSLYWQGKPLEWSALEDELQRTARESEGGPPPDIHIHADGQVPYEKVAQFMSASARTGLTKIGFVTSPASPTPASSSPPSKEK